MDLYLFQSHSGKLYKEKYIYLNALYDLYVLALAGNNTANELF